MLKEYYNGKKNKNKKNEMFNKCLRLLRIENPEFIRTRKDAIYVDSNLLSSWDDPIGVEVLNGELDRFNKSNFPEKSHEIKLAARRIFFHSLTGHPSYYSEKTNSRQDEPMYIGLLECGFRAEDDVVDHLKKAFDTKGHVDLLGDLQKTSVHMIPSSDFTFVQRMDPFQMYPHHNIIDFENEKKEERRERQVSEREKWNEAAQIYKNVLEKLIKLNENTINNDTIEEFRKAVDVAISSIIGYCKVDGKYWSESMTDTKGENKRKRMFGIILSQAFTYGALLRRLTLIKAITKLDNLQKSPKAPPNSNPSSSTSTPPTAPTTTLREVYVPELKRRIQEKVKEIGNSLKDFLPLQELGGKKRKEKILSLEETIPKGFELHEYKSDGSLTGLLGITVPDDENDFMKALHFELMQELSRVNSGEPSQAGSSTQNLHSDNDDENDDDDKDDTTEDASNSGEPSQAGSSTQNLHSDNDDDDKDDTTEDVSNSGNSSQASSSTQKTRRKKPKELVLRVDKKTNVLLPKHINKNITDTDDIRVNIPNHVTEIGLNSFARLNFIKEIDLSKTEITTIGIEAFLECNNLTSVKFPNTLKYIGSGAFINCSSLTAVDLSDTVLKDIFSKAFTGCRSLNTVRFPNSLKKIGVYAFLICEALTAVDLRDTAVKYFEGALFSQCTSLTSVEFPKTLRSIGVQAFINCPSLTAVDLSDTVVEDIREQAFSDCIALKTVHFPNSLKKIDVGIFSQCTSLTAVDLSDTVVQEIRPEAFSGCESLISVEFPNTLVYIKDEAFLNCSSLTAVNLSDTVVEEIREQAFSDCIALISVEFPNTLVYISTQAFINCSSLTAVNLSDTVVEEIRSEAFSGCESLTSVEFPKTLVNIGVQAFLNCPSLTAVDLSDTVVEEIRLETFSGCESLISVEFANSLKEIGYGAFYKCTQLNNVDLSNTNLQEIKSNTFQECKSLTTVQFPNSLEKIGEAAFYKCTQLNNVNLSNTKVTMIDSDAFDGCEALTTVQFPIPINEKRSMLAIGDNAFHTKLENIEFRAKLTIIGEEFESRYLEQLQQQRGAYKVRKKQPEPNS
jgi:hypothetical protein